MVGDGQALKWREVTATRIANWVDWFGSHSHNPHLSILDMGCGDGLVSWQLADMGYEVTGVDINAAAIKRCSRYFPPRAAFQVADITTLHLGKLFDVVVCSEVLEHIPQVQLALQSIYEHLKDSGLFILSVPNKYSLREMVTNHGGLGRWLSQHTDHEWIDSPYQQHVHFWTLDGIRDLLLRSRFMPLSVSNLGICLSTPHFLRPLAALEYSIDLQMPHCLAGGWLITATK